MLVDGSSCSGCQLLRQHVTVLLMVMMVVVVVVMVMMVVQWWFAGASRQTGMHRRCHRNWRRYIVIIVIPSGPRRYR